MKSTEVHDVIDATQSYIDDGGLAFPIEGHLVMARK